MGIFSFGFVSKVSVRISLCIHWDFLKLGNKWCVWTFPLLTLNKNMPAGLWNFTQLTYTCSKSTIETLLCEILCEISSKLTIKTPKRRHWRRSGVFIVNFEHISHPFSSVSIVMVTTSWKILECPGILFLPWKILEKNPK